MKRAKVLLILVAWSAVACADYRSTTLLEKYKHFLDNDSYAFSWRSNVGDQPCKGRYHTFKRAFEHFEEHNGKVIVELGTTRSFVHGGLPGCLSDESRYWQPKNPAVWDWGGGSFTRVAIECLAHCKPLLHTVDYSKKCIDISKVITKEYKHLIQYHVMSSVDFLKSCAPHSIDLLYLDTGDLNRVTELLQLEEARIVVESDLLSPHGIILIDDVRHASAEYPRGKSGLSIPYLLSNGYEIVEDEYQVIMRRKARHD